jgi:anti-anti-sigma factor
LDWKYDMQIETRSSGDLLQVMIRGMLDHDSSMHFREEVESWMRDGWHRILVDLGGVTYLSSAGIAALVAAKQRLEGLNGLFGIYNATEQVEQVLSMTRLLDKLRCDPHHVRDRSVSGPTTLFLEDSTRFATEDGVELEIYALRDAPPLYCRLIGEPQALFNSADSSRQCRQIAFGPKTFGVGLGAIGHRRDASMPRFGEFLSVAGAMAQSPQSNGGLPDYLLAAGDFVPSAQVLYGVQCEGDFPNLIRFAPEDADGQVGLSQLVRLALHHTRNQAAGFVILADCAGLIGAQLRDLPSRQQQTGQTGFALPGLRTWLSFTAEHIHRRNLVLIVGLATVAPPRVSSPLHSFLRPLDAGGELTGHFHAAAFPYRPLKKRTLPFPSSVTDLFESGSIEDVLHLLHDDRPITGLGESQLFGGACWVGPIGDVIVAEGDV